MNTKIVKCVSRLVALRLNCYMMFKQGVFVMSVIT